MMKIYIVILMSLLMTLPMMADDAKTILEKAVSAVEKSGGIEAKFKFEAFKQNSSVGTSTGTIQLKGDKFKMQTADAISWFDGKTQWSYQVRSEEVTVTVPTAKELESVNPYRLLSLYKSGYTYKLLSVNSYGGRAVNAVELTATDKKRSFSTIVIYLSKSTNLPLFIRVVMRDKSRNDIFVTSCKTGTKPADSVFSFNKKEYPKVEIIDLR